GRRVAVSYSTYVAPGWRPGRLPFLSAPAHQHPTTTAERAQWFPSEGGDRRGGDAATIDVLRFESEPSQKATNDVNWFRWEDETGEGAHNVDEILRSIKDSREHDDLCLEHKLDLTEAL
ncbi:unnamed protein product, partial [Musa banksii]